MPSAQGHILIPKPVNTDPSSELNNNNNKKTPANQFAGVIKITNVP